MMPFFGLGVGLLLLLLALWLVARPAASAPGHETLSSRKAEQEARTTVIGPVIFSEADWIFINRFQNQELRRMFLLERRRVARCWLRQVALDTRKIMSDHARLARSSKKLNVQTELALAGRYFALVVCCSGLSLALYFAAPLVFGRSPVRVNRLLEELSRIHENETVAA